MHQLNQTLRFFIDFFIFEKGVSDCDVNVAREDMEVLGFHLGHIFDECHELAEVELADVILFALEGVKDILDDKEFLV